MVQYSGFRTIFPLASPNNLVLKQKTITTAQFSAAAARRILFFKTSHQPTTRPTAARRRPTGIIVYYIGNTTRYSYTIIQIANGGGGGYEPRNGRPKYWQLKIYAHSRSLASSPLLRLRPRTSVSSRHKRREHVGGFVCTGIIICFNIIILFTHYIYNFFSVIGILGFEIILHHTRSVPEIITLTRYFPIIFYFMRRTSKFQ